MQPTLDVFLERFPATVQLSIAAILLSGVVGCGLGAIAAAVRGSKVDRAISLYGSLCISSVDFWIGLLLILLIAVQLGWLPTSGSGSFKYLILPAVTLSIRHTGRILQVTRAAIVEETSKEYVVAARARGLPRKTILFKHMGRNAGSIIFTMLGWEFVHLLNGSVLVETVFAWPGIGYLTVQAIGYRDFPLVVTIGMLTAGIVVFGNLLLDIMYAWLDPRIRYT